jgi:hypothetical protein
MRSGIGDKTLYVTYEHKWAGTVRITLEQWIEFGPGSPYVLIQPHQVWLGDQEVPLSTIPTLYRNNVISRCLIGMGIYEDPWQHRNEHYATFKPADTNYERDLVEIGFYAPDKSYPNRVRGYFYYYPVDLVFELPPKWTGGVFELTEIEKFVLISNNSALLQKPDGVNMNPGDLLSCLVIGQSLFPTTRFDLLALGKDIAHLMVEEAFYTSKARIRYKTFSLKQKNLVMSMVGIELPSRIEQLQASEKSYGYSGLIVSIMHENDVHLIEQVMYVAKSMQVQAAKR